MHGFPKVPKMSFQRDVYSGVYFSKSTDTTAKSGNGAKCSHTSCSYRRGTIRSKRLPVGQKVITDLFLKSKQDAAKYNLLMFMVKLMGDKIYNNQM